MAFDAASRVVIYASVAGALVDLAADAAYTAAQNPLEVRGWTAHASGDKSASQGLVELDVDLPPRKRAPGLSGLADLMIVARAQGVLIAWGHHPDDVDKTFRRQAAAAGLDPPAFAHRLLAG